MKMEVELGHKWGTYPKTKIITTSLLHNNSTRGGYILAHAMP